MDHSQSAQAAMNQIKHTIDGAALAGIPLSIWNSLPTVYVVLGIIWIIWQMSESKYGQRIVEWLKNKLQRKT